MHRLLVPAEELAKDAPTLPKEALAHLKVLRPKVGEEIELFDGRGRWRVCRVETREGGREGTEDVRRKTLGLRPIETTPNLAPRPQPLTLFACVTKGSRWDWTVEKATELGVTRIVPVLSARTVVRIATDEREAKRARWTRIAEDAARQSDAKWIPEVLAPVPFADSLALVKGTRCFVGALATPPPRPIGSALAAAGTEPGPPGRTVAVYVGPEGDFTPEELAALVEIATPVSFGSTVLRAETAAIYGLSALKAHLDSLQMAGRPR